MSAVAATGPWLEKYNNPANSRETYLVGTTKAVREFHHVLQVLPLVAIVVFYYIKLFYYYINITHVYFLLICLFITSTWILLDSFSAPTGFSYERRTAVVQI